MKSPLVYIVLIFIALLGLTFWVFDSVSLSEDKWLHLLSLSLILGYISLGYFQKSLKLSQSLKHLTVWIGIALILILGYAYRNDLQAIKNRMFAELVPSSGQSMSRGELTFAKADDGHFYIDASVDGVEIRFMVDTGASRVVLNKRDAQRLGLNLSALDYVQQSNTANGTIWSAPYMLSSLSIQSFSFQNIPASISQSDLDISLLGMSFLEKLAGYHVDERGLTLRF